MASRLFRVTLAATFAGLGGWAMTTGPGAVADTPIPLGGGVAWFSCFSTAQGALSDCELASETPRDKGYGEAAKALIGSAKGKKIPAAAYDQVVAYMFDGKPTGNARQAVSPPILPDHSLIPRPPAPSDKDFAQGFVERACILRAPHITGSCRSFATTAGIDLSALGKATLECQLTAAAALTNCKPTTELPIGIAASPAAQQLVANSGPGLRAAGPTPIQIDLRLPLTDAEHQAMVQQAQAAKAAVYTNADWARMPSITEMWNAFPELAAQTGYGGSVTLRCHVLADGTVAQCVVVYENPVGLGFGAAALRLAPAFKLKPVTANGIGVDGTITIPITWESQEGPAKMRR